MQADESNRLVAKHPRTQTNGHAYNGMIVISSASKFRKGG